MPRQCIKSQMASLNEAFDKLTEVVEITTANRPIVLCILNNLYNDGHNWLSKNIREDKGHDKNKTNH